MTVDVFDDRACILGEGPLWHPERRQLFWFDIIGQKLMTRTDAGPQEWRFNRPVSAAGWIDRDRLLIASDVDLFTFDLTTGTETRVTPLEDNNPATRSNDGRADRQGGFWIGTMGRNAEAGAGALYRCYRGELRCIRADVTIPNATCFTADGKNAYFADTAESTVWRYRLDADGWPAAEPEVFLDHREAGLNPDGAVLDAEGNFWCAEWGASRVACYSSAGDLVEEITLPVPQPTCPAIADGYLYVTSALQGLPDDAFDTAPHSGKTLRVAVSVEGLPEPQVSL
ncbi:SMP-30/gluconolactonase/LRE family protein [Gymnodinialimonas ceratoperidinii]|uniref:SMP-30/gluconolactonase/LRE family protein n=1 Tax=Gymnodinialimonas ceratoperidinii TaxID=2856823 RepID=A0A8F6TYB2_9RHOB|nr:SMP-30/gluconolactonase/LRE family protein [Gymnodinialimonas ceratoperidinii]QXT40414.1 SMP-30/gluconolactonase/LRE family protein [Gymnodinialimonas ceratoperidinii]